MALTDAGISVDLSALARAVPPCASEEARAVEVLEAAFAESAEHVGRFPAGHLVELGRLPGGRGRAAVAPPVRARAMACSVAACPGFRFHRAHVFVFPAAWWLGSGFVCPWRVRCRAARRSPGKCNRYLGGRLGETAAAAFPGRRGRCFVGGWVYFRGQVLRPVPHPPVVSAGSPGGECRDRDYRPGRAVADIASVPEGTTASRCEGCGEIRLQYPGSLLDPWKKHFDYCAEKKPGGGSPAAGPR